MQQQALDSDHRLGKTAAKVRECWVKELEGKKVKWWNALLIVGLGEFQSRRGCACKSSAVKSTACGLSGFATYADGIFSISIGPLDRCDPIAERERSVTAQRARDRSVKPASEAFASADLQRIARCRGFCAACAQSIHMHLSALPSASHLCVALSNATDPARIPPTTDPIPVSSATHQHRSAPH